MDKFAFPHCATLEQNLRFPNNKRHKNRATRHWDAYFLQLSKNSFRSSTADRNVSASRGAQRRLGADTALENHLNNKKPGFERRASPSFPQALQLGH